MCTVSIKEFNQNPAKFLQIAETEPVVIKGEGQTFELVKKEVFISVDEARKRSHEFIETLFEGK